MSGLAALTISAVGGAALSGAVGFGAYKGLEAATGNFGQDAADAIKDGTAINDKRLREGDAVLKDAGADAQAGQDPYAQTGVDADTQMRNLAGLNGPDAQAAAFAAIQSSPAFLASVSQSEQAILANGAATGGLRGGNMQDALANNRQQLMSQMLQQQLAMFGGLSQAGQGAAAQQGAFGLNAAGGRADILGNRGQNSGNSLIAQQAARQQGTDKAIGLGMQGAGALVNIGTGGGLGAVGGVAGGVGGGF